MTAALVHGLVRAVALWLCAFLVAVVANWLGVLYPTHTFTNWTPPVPAYGGVR